MKLVDIITYNNKKPVDKLEYLKNEQINFVREPSIGFRFMFTGSDRKIYRTPEVIAFNYGDNYLIIETKTESYIFIEGGNN